MDNIRVGKFLQSLRKENKLTQLELANKLNVRHQTVSKWERGDSLPDISTLTLIANFYNITLDEILKGERQSKGDINKMSYDRSNDLEQAKIFSISRLISSAFVFISLFLYYLTEKIRIGDQLDMLNGFDPFNLKDQVTELHYKGFNLIFNASKLTVYTGGALLIFLASLALIVLFTLSVISIYNNHKVYSYIKRENYRLIKLISEVILTLGFGMIFIGVITSSSVGVNVGFIIGVLFTISLVVINLVEKKNLV